MKQVIWNNIIYKSLLDVPNAMACSKTQFSNTAMSALNLTTWAVILSCFHLRPSNYHLTNSAKLIQAIRLQMSNNRVTWKKIKKKKQLRFLCTWSGVYETKPCKCDFKAWCDQPPSCVLAINHRLEALQAPSSTTRIWRQISSTVRISIA